MNVFDLQLILQAVDPNLPVYKCTVDNDSTNLYTDWPVGSVTVRPVDNLYPMALVIE